MNAYHLPLAIIAFLGFAAIVPIWMHFLGEQLPALSPAEQFLASVVLPALAVLFLASWIQPQPR